MKRATRIAIRRPRAALAAWLVATVVLALVGTGVQERLTQSIFVLPGTETQRATDLTAQNFGESVFIPVLLEGPPNAINRQGPELVQAILDQPGWRALSPWDRGQGAEGLRPRADEAMIVASVEGPYEQIFDETADDIRGLVDEEISAPVQARVTGMPIIGNSIKDQTYDSARHAERIAIPILFFVLLLVFRAPIAALFPALTGLATVLASSGLIWILAGFIDVDPLAISLASMMGLALGVDYSLLIVSRFREEVARGRSVRRSAVNSMASAGRTVAFAGAALILAMGVGVLIAPGDILASAAIGVISSTVLGLVGAFVFIPAALVLFGKHIDFLRIGGAAAGVGAAATAPLWLRGVRSVLRNPGITALLVTIPLLLLTIPALGLNTGPPDVSQLPENDPTRLDYERIAEVMGPGWAAPFEVLVVSDNGPLTTKSQLDELKQWQRSVADNDDVASVVGPGALANQIGDPQGRVDSQLAKLDRANRGLGKLERGITQAQQGVAQIGRAGDEAANAAGTLSSGNSQAAAGTDELVVRLAEVAGGAKLISEAVGELGSGGEQLDTALRRAQRGTGKLIDGLGYAQDQLQYSVATAIGLQVVSLTSQADLIDDQKPRVVETQAQLEDALAALEAMGVGKTDPQYQAAYDAVVAAYQQVAGNEATAAPVTVDQPSLPDEFDLFSSRLRKEAAQSERTEAGVRRLAAKLGDAVDSVKKLREGLLKIRGGADQLRGGAVRIRDALGRLRDGVIAIGGGTEALGEGLQQLASGAGLLESGLRSGNSQVGALFFGLGDAADGAGKLKDKGKQAARRARRNSSQDLFDSGYFVLAGIENSSRAQQDQASVVVNTSTGGEAGRIIVVPVSGPNDDATSALRDTLSREADDLAAELDAETAVGGTAAALAEYDQVTSKRLLWLILGLAAVSLLVLTPIFGSLLAAVIAVLLNLLSVGAAFGMLAILFQGEAPILGGPGYVDAVSVSAMYTVIFGLSLDYQVFLISRMREGWEREGNTKAAIAYGLERTGAVVTGAAVIMIAVFVAFALTDVAGTRQFGAGMVVAVAIDATLVRLLLLPAALSLAGDRVWGRRANGNGKGNGKDGRRGRVASS